MRYSREEMQERTKQRAEMLKMRSDGHTWKEIAAAMTKTGRPMTEQRAWALGTGYVRSQRTRGKPGKRTHDVAPRARQRNRALAASMEAVPLTDAPPNGNGAHPAPSGDRSVLARLAQVEAQIERLEALAKRVDEEGARALDLLASDVATVSRGLRAVEDALGLAVEAST